MTDEELLRIIAKLSDRISRLEQAAGIPQQRQPLLTKATTESESHDELETRIGAHWLNRVGIVAVLIGVSYFLKYAFDNEWIGPAGQVVIGLGCGLGIVVWSESVRRHGYAVFSYSLKAVGIGVLYLSLWASSQLYQLIPLSLAFVAMVMVTAATVALALWQNAEVIAAFAALGAFMTPVALSTGQNNAIGLFSYVTILNVGALILARYRPWVRILLGSYTGTLILYSAWHSRHYTTDQFWTAFAAASAVFIVFAAAPFLDRHPRDSNGILLLALANAATYFFEVWELFEHAGATRQAAVVAVGFGSLYFIFAHQLKNRATAVTTQVHWTIGAALLIAAVPLGLDTPWITIAWFIEAAALVGVSGRTGNQYIKYLAAIALVLGVVRLLAFDNFGSMGLLVFNERMLSYAVAVGSLVYVAFTLAAAPRERERGAIALIIVTSNVLALIALNLEITDAFRGIARNFAYSALWMAYGAGLMFAGFWKKSRFLRWQALILIAITIGKVFLYDTSSLDRGYRILSLIALGFILLATSFLYQRDWFRLGEKQ